MYQLTIQLEVSASLLKQQNKAKYKRQQLQMDQKEKSKDSNTKKTIMPFFSTNNVLIHRAKIQKGTNHQIVDVYLPGYMRIFFKNFLNIDLVNLTSLINITIIFSVYYGDLFEYDKDFLKTSNHKAKINAKDKDKEKKDGKTQKNSGRKQTFKQELIYHLMNEINLHFSRDSALLLSTSINGEQNPQIDIKHIQNQKLIEYTIRKKFHVFLDGNLKWSPFEIINSLLEITIDPITFNMKPKDQKTSKLFNIKFNLMDHPEKNTKIFFGQQRKFDYYYLAKKLVKAISTNIQVANASQLNMLEKQRYDHMKSKEDKKIVDIKYFKYAYFNIPMFKSPFNSLITVFVPLWLLGLINLGIYFQDENLSDRIGSIIGLMLAFIAYIPTIRQAIPPSSSIVFMEVMVYLQSLASFATFIHSFRIKSQSKFVLDWIRTPEYWFTFLVTVGSFSIVLILMLLHYFYWSKKVYNNFQKYSGIQINRQIKDSKQNQNKQQFQMPNATENLKSFKSFNRKKWSNIACDVYFNEYFQHQKEQRVVSDNSRQVKKTQKKEEKEFKDYFIIDLRYMSNDTVSRILKFDEQQSNSEISLLS